eukprot:927243_1
MSQSENPSSNQTPESSLPPICAGGCGFYGNKDQKNCCSVCFKKMYPEEASKVFNKQPKKGDNENINNNNDKNTESKEDENKSLNTDENKPKKKIQKKKNRCWNCRKKMTLAGQFECKCGYVFCGKHRYPDAHQCDFDHKKVHKDKLAEANKTVAPEKVGKI